jgi:hypothetical protein
MLFLLGILATEENANFWRSSLAAKESPKLLNLSGGVPVGGNAAVAGLTPGVPIPPTPVRVIIYP